jgi:hypothetical protein
MPHIIPPHIIRGRCEQSLLSGQNGSPMGTAITKLDQGLAHDLPAAPSGYGSSRRWPSVPMRPHWRISSARPKVAKFRREHRMAEPAEDQLAAGSHAGWCYQKSLGKTSYNKFRPG